MLMLRLFVFIVILFPAFFSVPVFAQTFKQKENVIVSVLPQKYLIQ